MTYVIFHDIPHLENGLTKFYHIPWVSMTGTPVGHPPCDMSQLPHIDTATKWNTKCILRCLGVVNICWCSDRCIGLTANLVITLQFTISRTHHLQTSQLHNITASLQCTAVSTFAKYATSDDAGSYVCLKAVNSNWPQLSCYERRLKTELFERSYNWQRACQTTLLLRDSLSLSRSFLLWLQPWSLSTIMLLWHSFLITVGLWKSLQNVTDYAVVYQLHSATKLCSDSITSVV